MLMDRRLVDIAVTCANNTIHLHRVVLAANSIYFKVLLDIFTYIITSSSINSLNILGRTRKEHKHPGDNHKWFRF